MIISDRLVSLTKKLLHSLTALPGWSWTGSALRQRWMTCTPITPRWDYIFVEQHVRMHSVVFSPCLQVLPTSLLITIIIMWCISPNRTLKKRLRVQRCSQKCNRLQQCYSGWSPNRLPLSQVLTNVMTSWLTWCRSVTCIHETSCNKSVMQLI